MDGALDDGVSGEKSSFQNLQWFFSEPKTWQAIQGLWCLDGCDQLPQKGIHLQPATCWYKGYVTSNI